tara:strand:+ start:363 stop:1235 length:873 start_codon:yes stop_codon:yes gene_type:complete
MYTDSKLYSLQSFAEMIPTYNSELNQSFRKSIIEFLIDKEYVTSSLNDLTQLHKFIKDKSLMTTKNEVSWESKRVSYGFSELSKLLYKLVDNDNEFQRIYMSLLANLYELQGVDFYFQQYPTIRVHFPVNSNQNDYPLFHNDMAIGHPPSEINLWMPITINKECTFSIMSYRDSLEILEDMNFDYKKFNDIAYNDDEFNEICFDKSKDIDGENGICDGSSFCIFNSLRLHSTISPREETRISIDTRIIPVENFDFDTQYKGEGRMGAEFWPGGKFGYYEKPIKEVLNETR